jgi:hypothetical protein
MNAPFLGATRPSRDQNRGEVYATLDEADAAGATLLGSLGSPDHAGMSPIFFCGSPANRSICYGARRRAGGEQQQAQFCAARSWLAGLAWRRTHLVEHQHHIHAAVEAH